MEEAEVCCQKIGIMAKGSLRCLGSSYRLKKLYGSGYNLYFSGSSKALSMAESYFTQFLPSNGQSIQLEKFDTIRHYTFKPSGEELAIIFEALGNFATEIGIESWGISQTTLDEIFSNIISEDDASA